MRTERLDCFRRDSTVSEWNLYLSILADQQQGITEAQVSFKIDFYPRDRIEIYQGIVYRTLG